MEMELTDRPKPVVGSGVKLILGIFFAFLGILLTLDNLGVREADRILEYWPVLLIAIGFVKVRREGNRAVGVVAIVGGALLLLANLDWIRWSLFDFWPVLLILLGGSLVLRSFGVAMPAGSSGSHWAILSSRKLTMTPRELHGQRFVSFMGGCQVQLTDDGTDDRTPVIVEVLAMWGGVGFVVPEGWEVIGELTPIMGGVDIKTRGRSTGRQLVVRGLVLMGGTEAKTR